MNDVTEIKRQRFKKIFANEGLNFSNLRFCFDPYQFHRVMREIFSSDKNVNDILQENRNLYALGYLYEKTNQIYLMK